MSSPSEYGNRRGHIYLQRVEQRRRQCSFEVLRITNYLDTEAPPGEDVLVSLNFHTYCRLAKPQGATDPQSA